MKITPVKGTNDYLPNEVKLRDYLQDKILQTYKSCGFERIVTPALEDMDNLDKSDGGENLGLIFKVLKRGEKLTKALDEKKYDSLADIGLRYDLTLPLARYYANNRDKITVPFKCIQIDRVYRAERPQRGRLREFVQCDIDIIGTDSIDAEIELINVTAKALLNIGIKDFKVKINDRRVLKSIIASMGFEENQIESVCITFDKLDKIQVAGVERELIEKNFDKKAIEKFIEMLNIDSFTLEDAEKYCKNEEYIKNLAVVIEKTKKLSRGMYTIEYDKSLVRGQGYYTGMVFEIASPAFGSSIAGGGRYDNMIGKFIDEAVPAVGFSIGFERIASILLENQYKIRDEKKKVAVIYDEQKDITDVINYADKLRDEYNVALVRRSKKLGKLLNRLSEQGFYGAYIFDETPVLKIFDN